MSADTRSRRDLAFGCAGALVIALCGPAGAANADAIGNTTLVEKDGDTLRITADYDRENEITIEKVVADFLITDLGDTVAPGNGCAAVNANTVSCPVAGITRVVADTRNRDDMVDASAADAPATLRGGGGRDTLMGTALDDWIEGGNGDDVMLNGDAGFDRIFGGDGHDMINAENGDDYGEGGSGDDTLNGGDDAGVVVGRDHLIGGSGRDTFNGGPGNDRLEGNGNDDVINGDAGDDRLIGGPGWDQLNGGGDTDTCRNGNDAKTDCEL
jgi:Ca2+-binding RTX toxin-like protein